MDHTISVQGQTLKVHAAGKGETIVLLHDALLYSIEWEKQVSFFEKEFQMIAYDRRGYGINELSKTVYSDADDLLQILKYFDLKQVTLVGSSNGGKLALNFTLQQPSLVKRLVLIGTSLPGYPMGQHSLNRIRYAHAPLREGNLQETIERWIADPFLIAASNHSAREQVRTILAQNSRSLENRVKLKNRVPETAIQSLSQINCPTLVLTGEHDSPDVHAQAGICEILIKNSKREIITGAAHLPSIEQPDLLNQQLSSFMKR